jgi:hypothetical protein
LIPLHLPQLCQRAEASEFVEIHINTPIEQGYYYYRYKQCNDRSREKKEDCTQDDREKTNANDDQSDPFVAQQTLYVHVLSSLVGFFNKLASLLWRVLFTCGGLVPGCCASCSIMFIVLNEPLVQ